MGLSQRIAFEICVNSIQMSVIQGLSAEGIKVVIVAETKKELANLNEKVTDELGASGGERGVHAN